MSARDAGYKVLEWDSNVFGFPVALLHEVQDRNTLLGLLEDARRNGVRLLYFFTDSDDLSRLAASSGGTRVTDRLVFSRQLTDSLIRNEGTSEVIVQRWTHSEPSRELISLARDAGRYSRFNVDPRVPEAVFHEIFDTWIRKSVRGELADEVMVSIDASEITGLVTVRSNLERAEIGLIAVRHGARGRGIGKALVEATLDWGYRQRLRGAQVVTQKENVAACHLYMSSGYAVERTEAVFHFWF